MSARRGLSTRVVPVLAVSVISILGSGCPASRTSYERLLPEQKGNREIREACNVTARKCTRCHDIDRVLVARVTRPIHWRLTVDRMRHMPSSGITEADADRVTRCLVYRSFGPAGLDELFSSSREEGK